jgi:hypothetical protein
MAGTTRKLSADYLVVGAGAVGMAFVDSLLEESEATVVMVDRRHAAGGHWLGAYPFVRLHQPSRYYGVNSTPLGGEERQVDGPEAGLYERAGVAEICAYYDRVMRERLLASGRVRFFPQCEHTGDRRFVSRLSGETFEVEVRRRIVDTGFLAPAIPAESPPRFEVDPAAWCVTPSQLASLDRHPDGYVVIGAGKTAIDVCLWLLEGGVDPDAIRWIKPREAWLLNRRFFQPGELVGDLLEGLARQMEAAAAATSAEDLFVRLEAAEQLRRVDPEVRPTMLRGATVSDWEIERLRRIRGVHRLGHVRRLERDRIVLEGGSVPTAPGELHVHCTAGGLVQPPPVPIFDGDRIALQPIRLGLAPFAAAITAFVEIHRSDDRERNRLCPPTPSPNTDLDWARATLNGMRADHAWSQEPDILGWLDRARLNPGSGLAARAGEPQVQDAMRRFVEHVRPGLGRLAEIAG